MKTTMNGVNVEVSYGKSLGKDAMFMSFPSDEIMKIADEMWKFVVKNGYVGQEKSKDERFGNITKRTFISNS